MDKEQIDGVLQRISGYYSNQPSTPVQVREFHRALAPLDAGMVDAAVSAHINTSQYRPKVADLLKLCGPMAQPGGTWHDCPRCDGTGWVDVEAPPGPVSSEQPWLDKCTTCAGSGRLPGIREAAERRHQQMTDEQLVLLWAGHDLERRQDGRMYRISDGLRVAVMPPEVDQHGHHVLPPLPDGTRPAATTRHEFIDPVLTKQMPE